MNNNFKIDRPEHIAEIRQFVNRDAVKQLASVKILPGQSLWQLNINTQEISVVNYDVTAINLDGSINSRIDTLEDHLYCVAINEKNALRKFIKMCNQITNDSRAAKATR